MVTNEVGIVDRIAQRHEEDTPHVFVDSLIEDVHQRRRDLLASCGNDLEVLARLIRLREAEHPERVADPRSPQQKPEP